MWRALGSEAAPPRLPRPRIGDRQALGLLLPLVALQAQIIEHERQHSEALLGQLCAVLRFNQRGRCAVARPVAVRTVALRWWVDPMQLGGFDSPLPKLVLCARETAGLDTAQYGALVDAACRCGLAQAVAHGGAPRRVVVPRQRCGVLVKDVLTAISLAIFAAIWVGHATQTAIPWWFWVIPKAANPAVQRRVTPRQ